MKGFAQRLALKMRHMETRENGLLIIDFKVPITSVVLVSHLIPHNTELTFSKKFFDFNKTQFLNVLKTFKVTAILVHHSHQFSPV